MSFCILIIESNSLISNEYLEDISALVKGFLNSSYNNKVKIIRNGKIYDLSENNLIDTLIKINEIKQENIINDLAKAVLQSPSKVLICETLVKNERSDLLKLIKIGSLAQKLNIQINYYFNNKEDSNENSWYKFLTESTNGVFVRNIKDLFKILSTAYKSNNHFFKMKCFCCNNLINQGFCCPICLTIYCKFKPICLNCKVKFIFIRS